MKAELTYGELGEVNVGQFCEKVLRITNRLLNKFDEAFDLCLIRFVLSDNSSVYDVRNYHSLSKHGQKYLLSLQDELDKFKVDFYGLKDCQEIADRIYLDKGIVFKYLQKYQNYEGVELVPKDELTFNTKVRGLSSFQILRDYQHDQRMSRVQEFEKIKQNK